MKQGLLALLMLALATAGCMTGGDDSPSGNNSTAPTNAMPAALPPPIEDSQQVAGSADPLNFAGEPPCASPTAKCYRYPFTLNGTATITAELTWGLPASDFDLYVFQDGAQVDSGQGASPPGAPTTREAIEEEFQAGEYELVVVPWSVGQDTFTISATFG